MGKAAYLAAMTTVFGHPGRRFGQLVEALTLLLLGTSLGLAWSILGLYLSSLTISRNPPSAYALKGVFLAVAVMVHGFLRSYAPRLFPGLILLVIVSAVTLLSTAKQVTQVAVTQILYPILIGAGVIMLVNLFIFPEFSSSFLGQVTIETLFDVAKALENAGHYFLYAKEGEEAIKDADTSAPKENKGDLEGKMDSKPLHSQYDGSTMDHVSSRENIDKSIGNTLIGRITKIIGRRIRDMVEQDDGAAKATVATDSSPILPLSALTSVKGSLRQKLTDCKAAQNECNFEIAFSVLPPRNLKSISARSMTKLLANTVAIISTCESKFALIGDSVDENSTEGRRDNDGKVQEEQETGDEDMMRAELDLVKPLREIEFGDVRLLRFLLRRVEKPYAEMSHVVFKTVTLITSCIAYTYVSASSPQNSRVPC